MIEGSTLEDLENYPREWFPFDWGGAIKPLEAERIVRIQKYFMRVSGRDERTIDKREYKELSRKGATKLKRKLLGFCGVIAIKSLDEISSILYQTGIAGTRIEAERDIIPELVDVSKIHHGITYGDLYFMKFEEVGDKNYRVTAWWVEAEDVER